MNVSLPVPRPRTGRRGLWAPLLLVCLLVAVLSPSVPASAAEGDEVSWTVRTASNSLGTDRTSFSYTVDPGGSVSDALVIANHGTEPLTLQVYAADGFTSEDGQLSLVVAGEESQAVGAWITSTQDSVTVEAGGSATVAFDLAVPDNATPGDYAGGVVTSLTVPDAATGVNVDRRLGIRVDLRVGGELAPSLAIEDTAVTWSGGLNPFAGGDATLTYTLHNTGNAAIAAQPAAQITGPFGIFGRDAEASSVPELLPGESWTQTVTITGVAPLLALFATVTATPLVVDASGSTSPLAEVSVTAVGPAIPWTLLVILLLLAAAVFLFFRGRVRRRVTGARREQERVDAAVAAALEKERATASAGAE